MDPIAEKDLQDLPVEVLDMILLKAVAIPLLMRRTKISSFICPKRFNEDIKTLRTVWSEWNYRLTTKWFWIKLKRLSRLTFIKLQKRINMTQHVDGIVKLKDRICVLSLSPSAIKVYMYKDFALEREIGLPLDHNCVYSPTIEPSVKSNSVYIQYRSETSYTIQKANIDEDNAVTIWLEDIKSWNDPAISVTRDDNVFVLTCDRVCLYSADAELISCVDMKKHSILHPWKIFFLPQGNFVIGFVRVRHEGYVGIMGEIVCEGEKITGFVAIEDNGRPIGLWSTLGSLSAISDLLWFYSDHPGYNFSNPMSQTLGFKYFSLDVKNRLIFLFDPHSNSLLTFDATSLSLVQSIPLRDRCCRVKATEVYTPSANVEGLCFDTEKRVLYIGSRWEETIDVYKVY